MTENKPGTLRRLAPGRVPDPLRAHGAWVYLVVSTLAGSLVESGKGFAPALLAAAGFLGLFLLAGAVAVAGRRGAASRSVLGLLFAVGGPSLALRLGADDTFLLVALLALPPTLAAAHFARLGGFLAPGALVSGVAALTVSAPVAATAGGASVRSALGLLVLLVGFFCWRTGRLARVLGRGWNRRRFIRRGLFESALAVLWGIGTVLFVRWLA